MSIKVAQEQGKVIVLEQKPIISYDLVEQKGKEVQELIASLNIENIEPSEDNLKLLKTTRTNLSKDFRVFEEQRKMVKDLIMKPYNDFEDSYKEHISIVFKNADAILKGKVSKVDDEILARKIEGLRDYFDSVNQHYFICFKDVGLKIIKSISDKRIKEAIDSYLAGVENALKTIATIENSDRVLARFQICKDMNEAISQVNMEVQRERQIAESKKQEEEKRAELERQRREMKGTQVVETFEEPVFEPDAQAQEPKLYKTKFEVTATIEDIKALKRFMNKRGIRYE